MRRAEDIEQQIKSTLESMKVEYKWIQADQNFLEAVAFCERYGFRY